MSTGGEKMLAAEMLGAVAVTFIAKQWAGYKSEGAAVLTPGKAALQPHQVLGQVFLYSGLAFVAMFGEQPARLAAGIGGLVLLVILLKSAGEVFAAVGTAASPPVAQPGFTKPPTKAGALA